MSGIYLVPELYLIQNGLWQNNPQPILMWRVDTMEKQVPLYACESDNVLFPSYYDHTFYFCLHNNEVELIIQNPELTRIQISYPCLINPVDYKNTQSRYGHFEVFRFPLRSGWIFSCAISLRGDNYELDTYKALVTGIYIEIF